MRLSGLLRVFVLVLLSSVGLGHSEERPNVVLFLVDDMGWMDSSDTGALAPKPNPAYREDAATASRALDAGLVPKFCHATLVEGALQVASDGRAPFLGTAQLRNLTGPLQFSLRIRGPGGEGRLRWMKEGQEAFPEEGQAVEFTLPVGKKEEWQEIDLEVPLQGSPRLLRIYLPIREDSALEIESIQFTDSVGNRRHWNFRESQP